jgi:hypothetical protein
MRLKISKTIIIKISIAVLELFSPGLILHLVILPFYPLLLYKNEPAQYKIEM